MKVSIKYKEQKVLMGPGKDYPENGVVHAGDTFTIIEQKNGYGLLKSRAGWIELSGTKILED